MSREYEIVELTNMCAVINEKTGQVLVQNRIKSWTGISFPGGHVEKGEAIIPSTIREIKEETGLDIKNLKSCGIKNWYFKEENRRYIVFLYATTDFSGELVNSTDEGEVFWVDIEELPQLELASSFWEMAEMMLDRKYEEFFYDIQKDEQGNDIWVKKFY